MTKRAIEHLKTDKVMARIIHRIGPLKLRPQRIPPFQSLVHAVIHQQLSGRAASTILGRFRSLFGAGGFPSPHEVVGTEVEKLRTAGLSMAKAGYVRDLAQKAIEGVVPPLELCAELSDN